MGKVKKVEWSKADDVKADRNWEGVLRPTEKKWGTKGVLGPTVPHFGGVGGGDDVRGCYDPIYAMIPFSSQL